MHACPRCWPASDRPPDCNGFSPRIEPTVAVVDSLLAANWYDRLIFLPHRAADMGLDGWRPRKVNLRAR